MSPRINPFYRTLATIGLALVLPTALVIALQIAFSLQQQQHDIELASLARAEQVSILNDARIETDLAAMRVLASASSLTRRDMDAFALRARQVMPLMPGWKAVVLTGPSGQVLSDVALSSDDALREAPPGIADPSRFNANGVGEVSRDEPGCPCVYLRTPAPEGAFLTVTVDPAVFEAIIAPRAPPNSVSATVDRLGNFVARSQAFEERVGTPGTRYVRQAVLKGGSGLYQGVTYEGLKNYTAYYTSRVSGWSVHIAVKASILGRPRNWSTWILAVSAILAVLIAGVSIYVSLSDLARRRQDEERRRQAQKLEALGRLTGGVAHDFNNLLTVIIGGLGMLLPKLNDPRSRALAEGALEAGHRGAKLTRQLLAFSRGQALEIHSVDLGALLEGMRDLMRQSLGTDNRLDLIIDPAARWVRSDANQLELAILNLVINARDAMPSGGTVTITTAPSSTADHVELIVSDTGAGMEPEVLERAMEPFFTTKAAGSGTGLGLAQVFGAVRQSGGQVHIDSRPGAGASVRLTLMRAEPVAAPTTERKAAVRKAASPVRRRILVVDDEPRVRDVTAETLRSAGYSVSEAPDGASALQLIGSDHIDLMVTDFAMPGMNGADLARRAKALKPDLRTVIISGHADMDAVEEAGTDAPLVRKPFTANVLLAAVDKALAMTPAQGSP